MPTLKRLVYATLAFLGVGAAKAQQEHWTNGASATGTTDPNVTNDCTYWANNIASDATCEGIETYFGIAHAELTTWNPSLLPDYCVLIDGWSYCVAGPEVDVSVSASSTTVTPASTLTYQGMSAPAQSGIISSCSDYYFVDIGDSCYDIQNKYMDFTLDQFYSWNPAISSGCKGLRSGYFVRVAVNSSSSSSAIPTTSGSASSTPSSSSHLPHQTGISSNCKDSSARTTRFGN